MADGLKPSGHKPQGFNPSWHIFLLSMARFAELQRTQLVELDVNPLLLYDNNETIAVDALIRMG